MRACQPRSDGYVERDGVKVHYELFGAGEPTVLLLPTWSIIHSRHWKMQIPYLARHCRVLTGRGMKESAEADNARDGGDDGSDDARRQSRPARRPREAAPTPAPATA